MFPSGAYKIAIFTLALVFLFHSAFAQTLELNVNESMGYYLQNNGLEGNIEITHDYPLTQSIDLIAKIDGNFVSLVNLNLLLPDPLSYVYENLSFDINTTREINLTETNYPDQGFNFTVTVKGSCGDPSGPQYPNQDCPPHIPPSSTCPQNGSSSNGYPCEFTKILPDPGIGGFFSSSIKRSDNTCFMNNGTAYTCSELKYVPNANFSSMVEGFADIDPLSVEWTSQTYNNPNVETTVRVSCGNEPYPYTGPLTQPNGWAGKTLAGWQDPGEGPHHPNAKVVLLGDFFGTRSLGEKDTNVPGGNWGDSSNDPARALFTDPAVQMGGIYEDGQYLSQSVHPGAIYDGTANFTDHGFSSGSGGYVEVTEWSPLSTYIMTFLPPSGIAGIGAKVCAWTNYQEVSSNILNNSVTFSNNVVSFNQPYSELFTEAELEALLPPPNCSAEFCSDETLNYYFIMINGIPVVLSYTENSGIYNVTATTTDQNLSRNYTETIGFSNFGPNLKAPEPGIHTLEILLTSGSETLSNQTVSFSTCADADNDSFCGEVNDCNDNNANIHPGATEACNGVDDNCDGEIDNGDFIVQGKVIGSACGANPSISSPCSGEWICTSDGQSVECSATIQPGDFREVCENDVDDDCDGIVDETPEDYGPDQTCGCAEGSSRDCPDLPVLGACSNQTGYQICLSTNEWSECQEAILPQTETCNRIDDDCDGVIDDRHEGSSVSETACGCYDNRVPQSEESNGCDDVDNDCDGFIDENLNCCNDGDTRPTPGATDVGVCRTGLQTCVGGSWAACEDCVFPVAELCFDGFDNNCDGDIDENCDSTDLAQLCSNGIKDQGEEGIDCGGLCTRACQEQSLIAYVGISIAVIIVILLIALIQFKGRF